MERNPSLDVDRNPSFPQDGPASPQADPSAIFHASQEVAADGARKREGNPRASFRSLRRLKRRSEGRSGEILGALEADALLLREENARLRVKLEAPPTVGHVIERLRALPSPCAAPAEARHRPMTGEQAEQGDEALHVLTEALVMRNALVEVCSEIGQVMAGLEARLAALTPSGQLMDDGNHSGDGNLKEARR